MTSCDFADFIRGKFSESSLNIPAYARACSTYEQFLNRGKLLTDTLIIQEFIESSLMSAFRKFYDRYNDLIHNYKLSLNHMLCYAPVTLSRIGSPIRADLKNGVDRGSAWVNRAKVWAGRDESGQAPTILKIAGMLRLDSENLPRIKSAKSYDVTVEIRIF